VYPHHPIPTMPLQQKLQQQIAKLDYFPRTFQLIWAASRYWTLAWLGLLLVQGVLPAATVYLTRSIVDSIVAVAGANISPSSIQTLLLPALLMAGVLLLGEGLQGASEWVRTAQSELVQDHISGLVHQQAIAIDYGCYESAEYNDYLERARQGASSRALGLLENTGSVLQNSITLFTMAIVLIQYGIGLPLLLVVSALPAFYVALQTNVSQYKWSRRSTTVRRRLQYYEFLLLGTWSAAELRIFNFGPHFMGEYQRLRKILRHEQLKLIQDQSLRRVGAGLVSLVIAALSLGWIGSQVLMGLIKLGDLALFYQAFTQGQKVIKALLNSLGQIYKNSLFINDLFEYLQLKPQIADPPLPLPTPNPLRHGIQLKDVTFRYPGSAAPVLNGFNLTLPAGQVVAIVGDNGAGKSTLLKLLCRLYDPELGSIEMDGTDIRHFSVADLRRLITVLFQDPNDYHLTVAENVTLGDLSAQVTPAAIEHATRITGIHDKIMRLPHGYESMLGKWFPDGNDLSGGEWQRLALARAFLRKAQLIILDEPTSAMDPWSEFDWLERFRSIAEGRTAVVITHRFTLAMRADIIHVMRAGQIVESGSHDQLLRQGGFYAQSWQEQMQAHTGATVAHR
jgi:ATP-binding cassette, subfamily B, bacterial